MVRGRETLKALLTSWHSLVSPSFQDIQFAQPCGSPCFGSSNNAGVPIIQDFATQIYRVRTYDMRGPGRFDHDHIQPNDPSGLVYQSGVNNLSSIWQNGETRSRG